MAVDVLYFVDFIQPLVTEPLSTKFTEV